MGLGFGFRVKSQRREKCRQAYKPDSVEDDHSSRRRITARAPATYPKVSGPIRVKKNGHRPASPRRAHRAGTQSDELGYAALPFLFGLAPCGVYPAPERYRRGGALLPHLFTLTRKSLATLFGRYLLCGTSRLAALTLQSRTLSGTLPCGVRTFLPRKTARKPDAAAAVQPACKSYSNRQSAASGERQSRKRAGTKARIVAYSRLRRIFE